MIKLKEKVTMVLLAVILFAAGFISGCGTIRGMASDIGDGARAIEKSLDPVEQSRQANR